MSHSTVVSFTKIFPSDRPGGMYMFFGADKLTYKLEGDDPFAKRVVIGVPYEIESDDASYNGRDYQKITSIREANGVERPASQPGIDRDRSVSNDRDRSIVVQVAIKTAFEYLGRVGGLDHKVAFDIAEEIIDFHKRNME